MITAPASVPIILPWGSVICRKQYHPTVHHTTEANGAAITATRDFLIPLYIIYAQKVDFPTNQFLGSS